MSGLVYECIRRTHDMNLYSRAAVCIVDIDSGELELPEELPPLPYEQERCRKTPRIQYLLLIIK